MKRRRFLSLTGISALLREIEAAGTLSIETRPPPPSTIVYAVLTPSNDAVAQSLADILLAAGLSPLQRYEFSRRRPVVVPIRVASAVIHCVRELRPQTNIQVRRGK